MIVEIKYSVERLVKVDKICVKSGKKMKKIKVWERKEGSTRRSSIKLQVREREEKVPGREGKSCDMGKVPVTRDQDQ